MVEDCRLFIGSYQIQLIVVICWVVGLLGGSSNLKFCANLFEGFIQSKVKANKEGAVVVVVVVAVVSFLGVGKVL